MNKRSPITQIDIILFNKPCNVLCQFTDTQNRPNLSNYIRTPNFYACGRLDRDSEGLLILSNDGKFQHLISDPLHKLKKTYWVQVDGEPDTSALQKLRRGITLKDGPTRPCSIHSISEPQIPARIPAIRFRKNKPTSWLEITLTQGRNRQVRRMTAAIGFPTLRLIRHRIGPWDITDIASGELRSIKVELESLPMDWQRYMRNFSSVRRRQSNRDVTTRQTNCRARN